MDIIFYKLQDEVTDVKKTRTLTATSSYVPITVSGTLRSATSKINPVIDFGKDVTYFNGWNYAYIADFNRYYFVDNPVSVRVGVTSLSFTVDVLTSFLTQSNMGNLEGYVLRSANSAVYEKYIPDNKVQFKVEPKITIYEPTSRPAGQSIENITFSSTTTLTNNVVISAFNYDDNNVAPIANITVPSLLQGLTKTATVLGTLPQPKGNCICYVTDTEGRAIRSLLWAVADSASLEDFIYSIMAFPFEVPNKTAGNLYFLTLDGTKIPNFYDFDTHPDDPYCAVNALTNLNSGYLVLKDFDFVYPTGYENDNFIAYEPYSNCDIYIPFAGWVNLDIKENIGDRLQVLYNVDYITGESSVMLYNSTKQQMIYQTNVQMGIKYPTSVTNAHELMIRGQQNVNNFMIGMLGSIIATSVGVVTHNPMLTAGGVTGIGKATTQFSTNEQSLIPKGKTQVASSSAINGVFGGLKVLIKFTQVQPTNYTSLNKADYIKHLGLPANKLSTLSSLADSNNYHTYCEIVDLHTTSESGTYSINDITHTEYQELQRLCLEGIYI